MVKRFAIAAAFFLTAAATTHAQVTSPLPGPFPADTTPAPFKYPGEINSPQFTMETNPASVIYFGDFPITLGSTPLSVATKVFGGELHHMTDRTDYLCYSAPLPEDPYAPSKNKKRTKKTSPEELTTPEPTYVGQNIWLVVGPRGEINEAKAEAVTTEGELCHRLPEQFQSVSFGPLKLGTTLSDKAIKKEAIPEPSMISEESPWRFWFANSAQDRFNLDYGFLGAELSPEGKILKLFSVNLKFRDH